MKIFVDANVLFTAAYSPKGKAFYLITVLHKMVITSDYAADEARRNLVLKRPEASLALQKILGMIEVIPSVQTNSCPIALPQKDQPIFLTAMKAKATHLLTGDIKDFGQHMNKPQKTGGIVIQTVSDFLLSLQKLY